MADFDKQEQSYEILCDVDKNGRDRDWKGRKTRNIGLGEQFSELGYDKLSHRVKQCAEVLKFVEKEDGSLRLYQTWFCSNKLCPICNWRKSLKHSYQTSLIIDKVLEEYSNARFLFLTLTVKNVAADKLNVVLSDMTKSFHRLFNRKKVSRNMLGYLRATEVTYNQKNDTYHPHIHVLMMVSSTYFKNKKNYITHKEWTEYWEKSANLGYTPVVDIRAVKSKRDEITGQEIGLDKAVRETAKYPVKPFDLDKEFQSLSKGQKLQVTKALQEGLYRKRQIAYGGLFKSFRKQLELDDVEDGDLVNVSDEDSDGTIGKYVMAQWDWRKWNYFIK